MTISRPSLPEISGQQIAEVNREQFHDSAANANVRRELYKYAYPGRDLDGELSMALGLPNSEETVVDIGCGDGEFLLNLARAGHKGRLIGINDSDIFIASQTVAQVEGHQQIEFLRQDATALELPDACADTVVAIRSLNHMDYAAALYHCERILKPGGKLGIITRGVDNLKRLFGFGAVIAEAVNRRPAPPFYTNFDIVTAYRELPARFEVPNVPTLQLSKLRIPKEDWELYKFVLRGINGNLRPGPAPSSDFIRAIDEIVKPQFFREIEEKGYFTDYVQQAYFIGYKRGAETS